MAACDVLYHDPAHAGPVDGWRPCPASGQVWTDPDQVLRFVCASPPPPARRPACRRAGRPHPLGPTRAAGRPQATG